MSLCGLRVAVVPGHAGKETVDPGAVDPRNVVTGDTLVSIESELTIVSCVYLARALQDLGAYTETITGSVSETVKSVGSGGFELALSVHFNAFSGNASGFEIWHSGVDNALAVSVEKALALQPDTIRIGSRGIKIAGSLDRARYFLTPLAIPALLIELGFLTSNADETLIHSRQFNLWSSTAIALGVYSWAKRRSIS